MRFTTLILTVGLACTSLHAQTPATTAPSGPVDLASLPAEIKSLKWKDIDFTTVEPLDRIRALMLMNDVLDELSAQLTAESDLMSTYIDVNNLGAPFVAFQPAVEPAPLTLESGKKVAVALLRGPMSNSTYASNLAGTSADVLTAYENMYTSTCQRKWSTLADTRLRVRSMSQYLQSSGKMADYRAWVPGEVKLQAEQQQALAAQQAAAEEARRAKQQEKRVQMEEKQLKQQQQQMQQQQQAAQQMQQALGAAQQSQYAASQAQAQAQANANAAAENGGYPNCYYGCATGLGVGAAAWYRNGAYLGAAQARTDARFAGWHGGGGMRR